MLRRRHVRYFLSVVARLHSWASLAPPAKVRQVCGSSLPDADTELNCVSVMCPELRVSEDGKAVPQPYFRSATHEDL